MSNAGRKRAPLPAPITEGQRLLQAICADRGLTYAAIAEATEANGPVQPMMWLRGETRPNAAARARIFGAFGIPPRAWDVPPGASFELAKGEPPPPQLHAAPLPPPAAPPAPRERGPRPTTLEACLSVIDTLEDAAAMPNLIASERIKLAESLGRMLALRARLETQAERAEDRIVREHPEWQRLKRVIVRTLAAHPAALKDLTAALGALGESLGGTES
jgi:transcriptional regulator with XRE-family HTH domain